MGRLDQYVTFQTRLLGFGDTQEAKKIAARLRRFQEVSEPLHRWLSFISLGYFDLGITSFFFFGGRGGGDGGRRRRAESGVLKIISNRQIHYIS